jgi:putative membrane protein
VQVLKYLIIIAAMVLGAVFAVMNAGSVTVNYYFGSLEMWLPLLLMGVLFLGALLGVLASMGAVLRLKRENAGLKRQARLATEEVKNLRAIPLKDH